jgi:hypothetical protein
MYSNDLKNVAIKDGKIELGFSGSKRDAASSRSPVAPSVMIVPFPNPTGGRRFGLISGNDTRPFRQLYSETFRSSEIKLETLSFGRDAKEEKAAVFQVGNYMCSVVPNLAELHASIDWNEFDVPWDFKERMAVFDDRSIIPESCGFVVAKAIRSVKDDGFGIVYPDDGQVYFPTCHENEPSKEYLYDACLYAFNVAETHNMPLDAGIPGTTRHSEVVNASPDILSEFYAFPMTYTDGTSGILNIHPSAYTHVSFRHIKGSGNSNCNISYPAGSSTGHPWARTGSMLQKPHAVDETSADDAGTCVMCSCKVPFAVSFQSFPRKQRCHTCNGQAWVSTEPIQPPVSYAGPLPSADDASYDETCVMCCCVPYKTVPFQTVPSKRCSTCRGQAWVNDEPIRPTVSYVMCLCITRATGNYGQEVVDGKDGTFPIMPRCDTCKGQAWPEAIPSKNPRKPCTLPFCGVDHSASCGCNCPKCGYSSTTGSGYLAEPTPKPTPKPFTPLDRTIMQKVINDGIHDPKSPRVSCNNCGLDTTKYIAATDLAVCLECVRDF